MQVSSIGAAAPTATAATPSTQDNATSAFNLSFESLLKIIMTQLSYQDPLKPMDNSEFVSQLAQFSQIQIGQTTNETLQTLATSQATLQATSMLGKTVDIPSGPAVVTGKVTAVAFADGVPKITIETTDGHAISSIPLDSISQVREGN